MSTTALPSDTGTRIANGAIAGLAGGVVFGVLMAMMGTLPMVGMLIGVDNAAVGFGVHLVNSAVIGIVLALLSWPLASRIGPMLGVGLVYGVVWWVLGALLIMPLWLSVTADPMMRDMVFQIGGDQWQSLAGHVMYGLVAAAALYALRHRASSS